MDFRILGPLEVSADGEPVVLGGPRQRALLAVLLLRANETVSRDWLMDELWEAHPPRSGATALHNQVARLRRTLGRERLLTRDEGYSLRVEPGELDLERFRELVAEAQDAPDRLREALSLWRGAPLTGVQLGPFAHTEAAKLEELWLETLEGLVDADLAAGRHAELVPELTALVASHPLSERLRGQLILALYRSGRQAEALDVYRETRRLLDEELGLEPSPALRELERAILRHDPALAPVEREPPAIEAATRPARRRRLAYIGAGTLSLAAAGAAAAFLLTRDAATGSAGPLASTPPPTMTTTRPAAVARPVTQPKRRAPVRRPKATTQATTTQAKRAPPPPVATTQAPAPETVTVPAATTTTTKPPRAEPASVEPKPFTISDDFSSAAMNPLVWYPIGKESGAVFTHRDGRLEVSIAPDAQPDAQYNQVGGHYGTHCDFTGDFDARVDFELLAWPEGTGAYAGLNLFFASAGVNRQSNAKWGDQYVAWVGSTGNGLNLPDRAGRLRLARVDGVITAYFWVGSAWRKLASGTSRGTSVLGLQLQADGNEFPHTEVRIAFDNFAVTATEADCPPFADPRG